MSRAHGVRGELRVVPQGDAPFPRRVTQVLLRQRGSDRVLALTGFRAVHEAWLLRLAGVDDRDAAAALAGAGLAVDAAELEPLVASEVYVYELEGATVVDEQNTVWGTVAGLFERPGQDLLRITGPRGELLLPFVPETIVRFDRGARTLVIRPLPGLWEADAGR